MQECKHTRLADNKVLFGGFVNGPGKSFDGMRYKYDAVFYRGDISWRKCSTNTAEHVIHHEFMSYTYRVAQKTHIFGIPYFCSH